MSNHHSWITYSKRTPIGKLLGGLSQVPAPQMGAALVKDALINTGVKADEVDEIIMGQVLSAGVGQAPARQTAIYGGLAKSVAATTINKVCGSGLKAVMLADQAIRLGEAEVVFAGGQENMSLAPHLLMQSRNGYKFGNVAVKDHMQWDGLWDPYNQVPMGNCGEVCAKEYNFTRDQQDQFALQSYQRARKAIEDGLFANEILAVETKVRRKNVIIDKDEEPFAVDLERLTSLRPAFDKEGSVTAGNASSLNDGAALVCLMNEARMKAKNLQPEARVLAQASYAHDPSWFTTAPIECIKKVLQKANLTIDDIDLFEVNEAFSVVTMAAIKDLNLDPERVNIYGGAVSLGHPIGASGCRVLVTLINALKQKNLKRGLATLCIGGGEASAVIIERA